MKKSDFLKRIQRGTTSAQNDETVFQHFARESVLAAEAAGVAWEPEGPPELPARLIVVKTGYNQGRLACQVVNNAIAELTLEELDEVKRRCEAWPELERLAEEMGPGYGLCGGCEIYHGELLTILRGGPR